MATPGYDPFAPGPRPVGVSTFEAHDAARDRRFPCELWYPAREGAAARAGAAREERDAAPSVGPHPLVVYSHHSFGGRRAAAYLAAHLASHGYAVAAMDHSESVVQHLAGPPLGETPQARAARIEAIVSSRVPDLSFLIGYLDASRANVAEAPVAIDARRVGLVGHSLGGWAVLAAPDVEPSVHAVVALAPGGGADPKPGVLRLTLAFAWPRPVPLLVLTGECDTPVPPEQVRELFGRAPEPKRLVVLRRADHMHFVDDPEREHEAERAADLPGDAAWMPAAMLPFDQLCSAAEAHAFTCALTLAHLDATLRGESAAQSFLAEDLPGRLAAAGVNAVLER